jgi:hypothetical protein
MKSGRRLDVGMPATYRIELQGRLDEGWSSWFDHMTVAVEKNADGLTVTSITGIVSDQSALFGLLSLVRDMGLPLLLVERVQ